MLLLWSWGCQPGGASFLTSDALVDSDISDGSSSPEKCPWMQSCLQLGRVRHHWQSISRPPIKSSLNAFRLRGNWEAHTDLQKLRWTCLSQFPALLLPLLHCPAALGSMCTASPLPLGSTHAQVSLTFSTPYGSVTPGPRPKTSWAWVVRLISTYSIRRSKAKTHSKDAGQRRGWVNICFLLSSSANRTRSPVPCHIQDVKLCGLWHLSGDPGQSVVPHAEHSEAAAPTDLQQERKYNLFPGCCFACLFVFFGGEGENGGGLIYQMAWKGCIQLYHMIWSL